MQPKDGPAWAQQVEDLRSDGEAGQRFLEFFEFWFDATEKMLAQERFAEDNRQKPTGWTVIRATRAGLAVAESQFGFLSVDMIGAMLVVAATFWEQGDEMAENLTFIERRVMEEALARKIAALQDEAAQGPTESVRVPIEKKILHNPEGPQ